ncbi:hypothetical protein D3C72_2170230 [compost metagenome]
MRNSDVLPTLVWPTTASFSGLVMAMLQPGQWGAVGMLQPQLIERLMPVAQAVGIQGLAGQCLQ